MNARRRGLIVLLLQVTLALAVLGRFELDRAASPRAWARTIPVDPEDPLRGRYVKLWLDLPDRRTPADTGWSVELAVEGNQLVVHTAHGWEGFRLRRPTPPAARGVVVDRPLAYFIPDGAPDPSQLSPGQELWVEVSVPARGLPRPMGIQIRTGVP